MMDIAIYLRKSRAEELNDSIDETLKRHKETLLEFSEKNHLNIKRIYEEVVSGESLYARPQMLKLLSDVEKGSYDGILCMDIDRLGRGAMSDQGIILETLKNANTKIITPNKTYDLNIETDETFSEFETFMARQELKAIKRRLQRGIQKSIADGCYIANAPYGYSKTTVNKRPTLAIKEEEARFVRLIFEMYVQKGWGCQKIADTIGLMGAKPRRSDRFGRTSIMKIIHNPVYIGLIAWNRKTQIRKGARGNAKQITIYNPKEKWTVVKGIHPPIIDRELFEQAQKTSAGRNHPPSNTGVIQNPLAGLVYCAHCGAVMQRQVVRGRPYLLCQNPGCMPSSALQPVEDSIVRTLKETYKQVKVILEKAPQPAEKSRIARKACESEIRTTEYQIERLHDLLERGIYDENTYSSRLSLLEEKKKKLAETRRALLGDYHENNGANAKSQALIWELYDSATPQGKNMLLKAFIDRVVYKKEKGAKPFQFTLDLYLRPFESFPSAF